MARPPAPGVPSRSGATCSRTMASAPDFPRPPSRPLNVLQHISPARILTSVMANALSQRILQDRFESPTQEAVLNLLVAGASVQEHMERLFAKYDVTPAQYNALRILKGVHPDGHPR